MTPREIVRTLWAKSDRNYEKDGRWLPVLNHLFDVTACAWEVLDLEPARTLDLFAADFGLERDEARRLVCALAGLHDLGKASPAFQVLWAPGLARVPLPVNGPELGKRQKQDRLISHGEVSQVLLAALLPDRGWSEPLAAQVADAVGCHHGRRSAEPDPTEDELGAEPWAEVQLELADLVFDALGVTFVPTIAQLSGAAFMRLAGLTSFADWVGSSFEVPFHTDFSSFDDPAGYFERARAAARARLHEIGWPAFAPLRPALPGLDDVFSYLPGFSARPLQTLMARELTGVSAPTLVLVEAPMGEGKTEAALYAFLQLQNALGHRGLYVALPTQATGSAMYGRLTEFLRAQGRGTPPDLQLLHGGALLNETFQKAVELTRNAEKDPAEARQYGVRAEAWFTHRKRALLSEYGVGTVDQALLGVLNVAHQFVRLWGLGNRVVVLDEVHAYDTYTSELIFALVRWLRALGSSVVVMSATLPGSARARLFEAWGASEMPDAAYPRLTVAGDDGEPRALTVSDRDEAGRASRPAVDIVLRPLGASESAVAERAVGLAEGGGCVVVIVNTVRRAQGVFEAVRRLLGDRTHTIVRPSRRPDRVSVHLFHARYPADERAYREERVLRCLGKQPATFRNRAGQEVTEDSRPERFILIATQVAEQSLDFDADVMISDLAPIDLLLQRAGRLHRHAANTARRHGHAVPVLHVSGLDRWPLEALKTEAWGRVYAPALLYRTWATLRGRARLNLPTDLDPLVQSVYAPDFDASALTGEQAGALRAAQDAFEHNEHNFSVRGRYAHIGAPDELLTRSPSAAQGEPDDEPASDDVAALAAPPSGTRLGDPSVRLVPVRHDGAWTVVQSPFAARSAAAITVRSDSLRRDEWADAKRIFERSLNVSRWELVAFAADHNALPLGNDRVGWRSHPLLRDAVPLDLTSGRAIVGPLVVRLDPELGLVYES